MRTRNEPWEYGLSTRLRKCRNSGLSCTKHKLNLSVRPQGLAARDRPFQRRSGAESSLMRNRTSDRSTVTGCASRGNMSADSCCQRPTGGRNRNAKIEDHGICLQIIRSGEILSYLSGDVAEIQNKNVVHLVVGGHISHCDIPF